MKKLLILAVVAVTGLSCASQSQLYNWKGYDNAVYSFTKTSDEQSEENLIAIYEKLIANSGGTRKVPPPGVCADYGYMMIRNGKIAEGKELLVKETLLYPESKKFIDRILIRFEE